MSLAIKMIKDRGSSKVEPLVNNVLGHYTVYTVDWSLHHIFLPCYSVEQGAMKSLCYSANLIQHVTWSFITSSPMIKCTPDKVNNEASLM